MTALHLLLIVVSCAASVLAQPGDPNYLAHGLYHPDILAIVKLPNPIPSPGGVKWADSYSVGDKCYCMPKAQHGDGIDEYPVETPVGWMTVTDACKMIGNGPGPSGHPIYNDIQCGNGPPNDTGNEHTCPGRVDIGKNGCKQIGPKWDFGDASMLPVTPPPPRPPPPPPPVRINSLFRDVGNGDSQDRKGLSGETWTHKSKKSIKGMNNGDKGTWFQTHRSGKKFTYTLDGFTPNRRYRVELGFAEVWGPNCSNGKRVQKIYIQNKLVKDKLDVYASSGCSTAHYEVFDGSKAIVANSQGKIRIQILAIVENAMLSTIKVDPASNSPPPPPRPSPPPPPGPSPGSATAKIVIDAGSKEEGKTLAEGKTWTYGVASSVFIKNTSQRAKFRTHRSAPKLKYVIPGFVPGTNYEIKLGFAEIWRPNCQNGKRILNVRLNGRTVDSSIDVYRQAGCEAALVKTYKNIKPDSRGRLFIEIGATVENAMVSLIEISGAAAKPTTGKKKITVDVGKNGGDDAKYGVGKTARWGKSSSPNRVPLQYRTHRWASDLKFNFDGFDSSKTHYVRLGFAEAYVGNCKNGKRRFGIRINGRLVQSDLDVYKAAGGCATNGKYVLRTYEAKPVSGKFEISFKNIVNNPMISFIEIEQK